MPAKKLVQPGISSFLSSQMSASSQQVPSAAPTQHRATTTNNATNAANTSVTHVHNSASATNTQLSQTSVQMQSQAFPTSNNNNNAVNQPQSIFLNPTNNGAANNTALNTQQSDAASSVLILTQRPQPNGNNNNSAAAAASTSNLQQHAANNVDDDDDHRGCRMLVDDDDEDDAPQPSRNDNNSAAAASASIFADRNEDVPAPAASSSSKQQQLQQQRGSFSNETQPTESSARRPAPINVTATVTATASVPQQNAVEAQRLCSNDDDDDDDDETCDEDAASQTVNQQQQAPQQQQQQSAGFSQANELAIRQDPVLAQIEENRQERRSTAAKADEHNTLVSTAAQSLKHGQLPPDDVQAALRKPRVPRKPGAKKAAAARSARNNNDDSSDESNDDSDNDDTQFVGSDTAAGKASKNKAAETTKPPKKPAAKQQPKTKPPAKKAAAADPKRSGARRGRGNEDEDDGDNDNNKSDNNNNNNDGSSNNNNTNQQLANIPVPPNSANQNNWAKYANAPECYSSAFDALYYILYIDEKERLLPSLSKLLRIHLHEKRVLNGADESRTPPFNIIQHVIHVDQSTLQRGPKLKLVAGLLDEARSLCASRLAHQAVSRLITDALTMSILYANVDMVLALQFIDLFTPEWYRVANEEHGALARIVHNVVWDDEFGRQHPRALVPGDNEVNAKLPGLPVPLALFYFLSVVAGIVYEQQQPSDAAQQQQQLSAARRADSVAESHASLTPTECYFPILTPEQRQQISVQQHDEILRRFSSLERRLSAPYNNSATLFQSVCQYFCNRPDFHHRTAAVGLLNVLEWSKAAAHAKGTMILQTVVAECRPPKANSNNNNKDAADLQLPELLRRIQQLFNPSPADVRNAVLNAAHRGQTCGISAALTVFGLRIEQCVDGNRMNVVHRSIWHGSLHVMQLILNEFCKNQSQDAQPQHVVDDFNNNDDDDDDPFAVPESKEARGAQQQQQQQQTRCWWDTRCTITSERIKQQLQCTPLHLVIDKFNGDSAATAIGALKRAGAIYEAADPTPYSMTIDEKVQKAFYDNYKGEVKKEDALRRAKEAEEMARKDAENNARKAEQQANKETKQQNKKKGSTNDAGGAADADAADAAAKPAEVKKPTAKRAGGKKTAAAAEDADAAAGEVAAGAGSKPPPKRGKKSNNGKNNNNDGLAGEK